MNETSKLKVYRSFKRTLATAAAELGAYVERKPREGEGAFRVIDFKNEQVEIELTFTHYTHNGMAPAVYIGPGTRQKKLTNLSATNLKAHLSKHLSERRAYLAEMAEDSLKDKLTSKAEQNMAATLTTQLALPEYGSYYEVMPHPDDYFVWQNAKGTTLKLAYIGAEKNATLTDGYEITYNFDYTHNHGSVTRMTGEFDTTSLAGVLRTVKALNSI